MSAAAIEAGYGRGAAHMAANAKGGGLIVNGERYALTFDHINWAYDVTDSSGADVVRFNTKSLQTARKWLREYLDN